MRTPSIWTRTARGAPTTGCMWSICALSCAWGSPPFRCAPKKAVVAGPDGKEVPVESGSYGIGVSRLVGAIIEASHDDAGIVWPEPVAPFDIALLNLKKGDAKTDAVCEDIYAKLTATGKDVLHDDTDERPGAKFATHDLIGTPWQIIGGPRGLEKGVIEVKGRATGNREELPVEAAINRFAAA